MAKKSRIKHIRKCLLSKKIFISDHTQERMFQRGYNSVDIIQGILNGCIVEVQKGYDHKQEKQALKFVIEGKDYSDNPIIIVILETVDSYCIVTVMPPTDENRFTECI